MSAPRHLWSGDWEEDSAAHAEALARRNALRSVEPSPEEAAPAPPVPARRAANPSPAAAATPPRSGPTIGQWLAKLALGLGRLLVGILRFVGLAVLALAGGLRALLRGTWRAIRRADRRRVRLGAVAVLLIAAVAVAAVVVLGSGGSSPSGSNVSPAVASISRWLGVQLTQVPGRGVVFETVSSSGLAGAEGFEPGDVVAQIDNHTINGFGDLVKAFRGVQPGDQIAIGVARGSGSYVASFPMPQRPSGGP
jgi:hypothetical protein